MAIVPFGIPQLKTDAGAPTHQAFQGSLCYVIPDNTLYCNDDGGTAWVLVTGAGGGAHDIDGADHTDKDTIASAWTLVAGGIFTCTSGNPPSGELVPQVKTTSGAPTHSASEGTLCWNAPDDEMYVNNDGATGWTQLGSAGALTSHDHTVAAGDGGVLTNDEHDGFSELAEIASPATPAANKVRFYAKDKAGVSELYYKNDAGTERDLSAGGGGAPTAYPYLGFGTHADLSAEVDITVMQLVNELMNFPSMEGADGVQPEWWEEADANAILTEEDVAGEGITENYARALKVVVAVANSYAYQRYTYADQPRIKSGRKFSAVFAVWSVGGVSARVRLQSSVGSLGVSADTTAAAWTILTVNGVTLDGTYVEVRCEVDIGTAYFMPLGINIGARAVSLPPRGLRYIKKTTATTLEDLGVAASKAWGDVDCTAVTSPLAIRVEVHIEMYEATAADEFSYHTRINGSSEAAAPGNKRCGVRGADAKLNINQFTELLDDGQILETTLVHNTGGGTVNVCRLPLDGWWEWS